MRIEERIAAETGAQQSAAGAAEVQRMRAGMESGSAAGGAGRDIAQISTLAGRIRSRLDAMAAGHAARVEQLTAEVRSGRYQVDVAALSRAMAAEALGADALGGEAPGAGR